MNKVPQLAGRFPAFRVAVFAAIGLTITPWSQGQMAADDQARTPAAARTSEMEEKVIRMDPFTVTTENEGYQAVDTLGGARVATKLADTPSAISVITKTFLDNVGITNAQQLLVYTTDTEVAGLYGNFGGVSARGIGVSSNAEAARLLNPSSVNRARALTAMDNTRNYFASEIPWDSFNISRVDISRGPNSFLYGVGSPSGIANVSTYEAIYKNEGTVEARLGSYGTTRESLDLNRVLIPNELAVRIDLLNDDTQNRQEPAFSHSKRAYAAARFDPKFLSTPSSHMSIKANAESGRVRSNNPRELPPMDFITGYFADPSINKHGYDPFVYGTNQQLTGVGSFQGTSTTQTPQPALSPWINAQDYHYIWPGPAAAYWYDAKTGALLGSMTTFNGFTDVNGNNESAFPQAAALYITGFQNYAMTKNFLDSTQFPGAYAGTVFYNNKSLADTSIFNFYNSLVDGPNKQEWQNWHTFNITIEESLLNGRIALQGVVDHQDFDQGQVGIFGYTEPFISVDLDANLIVYPSWYPNQVVANPNVGRPFLASDTGAGNHSTHYVHDNYQFMANGDLRFEDFMGDSPLTKILGHHSFTALVGQYTTKQEDKAWNTYATDTTFAGALSTATGPNQQISPLISSNRTISWVSYIGPSLVSSNGSNLNLSNLANGIIPSSGAVATWDRTWTATGVNPADPWTDPSPYATNPSTQASNPANYRGWTNIPANVLNWHNNIDDLYTSGTKVWQQLRSAAFMYQGHFLDDVIIPEWGWRRDTITQRSSNAPLDPSTHVASMNYGITGSDTKFSTNSTSYGLTLH